MSDAAATNETPTGSEPNAQTGQRRKWLIILAVVVVVALAVWAIFHFLFASPNEATDDAYVSGDVVMITAREAGVVTALHADDTQDVRAGQTLIELDAATADAALDAAEADLALAVRATRADFGRVGERQSAVTAAQSALTGALGDLRRRQGATSEGAVSGEELAHAADQVRIAKANVALARDQLVQARTRVAGASVESNPAVLAAIAAYRRAAIARGHMKIIAPVAGVVALRHVQIGQQVPPGTPLMAVVPLARAWIDANFRETQLADLRIGQPATVRADAYGGAVVYHGRVSGLSAGSGNAFALLPPQNASGNWIKIVQRLPVRIALDPRELAAHPLRIGLSVKVVVDTARTANGRLATAAVAPYAAFVADALDPASERRIGQIIAANR